VWGNRKSAYRCGVIGKMSRDLVRVSNSFFPFLLIILFLSSLQAHSDTILNCTEVKGSSIKGKNGKDFGLETSTSTAGSEALKITLVLGKRKSLLKGNLDQVELVRVGKQTLLEKTPNGNVVVWTYLQKSPGAKVTLFQHKAFLMAPESLSVAYPISYTFAYSCD